MKFHVIPFAVPPVFRINIRRPSPMHKETALPIIEFISVARREPQDGSGEHDIQPLKFTWSEDARKASIEKTLLFTTGSTETLSRKATGARRIHLRSVDDSNLLKLAGDL
jgi:hypothetical protein